MLEYYFKIYIYIYNEMNTYLTSKEFFLIKMRLIQS